MMSTVQTPPEQRFILDGVGWRSYSRLLRAFADRPGVRLTYDRGALEIMTLSHEHENQGHLLGRLVIALTEELALPLKGGGSTTFRRRRRQRGLEPDECYWILNEPLVRGKDVIDLRRDPPPELALEIHVTHDSLDRLAIYVSLGIREVWRLEGQELMFHVLEAKGCYQVQTHSMAFPQLISADLVNFLAQRGKMHENVLVRQFRTWIRQRFALGGGVPEVF
jgi:Uma2 family endonuclease